MNSTTCLPLQAYLTITYYMHENVAGAPATANGGRVITLSLLNAIIVPSLGNK